MKLVLARPRWVPTNKEHVDDWEDNYLPMAKPESDTHFERGTFVGMAYFNLLLEFATVIERDSS
jgi:hypothetical protein